MRDAPRPPDHGGMSVPPHHERLAPAEPCRQGLAVSDDLPRHIPITDEEIRVLDAWFGDLLDELWELDT
ncbi:hypothetical protein D3C86_1758580 [compost metagenome]